MARPKCCHCSKALQEAMEPVYGPPAEQQHLNLSNSSTPTTCSGVYEPVKDRWLAGMGLYQCSECNCRVAGERIGKKGTGRYGYKGTGLFCTLRCGHDYAVEQIQAADIERRNRRSS